MDIFPKYVSSYQDIYRKIHVLWYSTTLVTISETYNILPPTITKFNKSDKELSTENILLCNMINNLIVTHNYDDNNLTINYNNSLIISTVGRFTYTTNYYMIKYLKNLNIKMLIGDNLHTT